MQVFGGLLDEATESVYAYSRTLKSLKSLRILVAWWIGARDLVKNPYSIETK